MKHKSGSFLDLIENQLLKQTPSKIPILWPIKCFDAEKSDIYLQSVSEIYGQMMSAIRLAFLLIG